MWDDWSCINTTKIQKMHLVILLLSFFQCYLACMMGLSHSVITTHLFLCHNYASQKVTRRVITKFPGNIHLRAIPCCPLQISSLEAWYVQANQMRLCLKHLPISSALKPANVCCRFPWMVPMALIISPTLHRKFELKKRSQVSKAREFWGCKTRVMSSLVRNSCTDKAGWVAKTTIMVEKPGLNSWYGWRREIKWAVVNTFCVCVKSNIRPNPELNSLYVSLYLPHSKRKLLCWIVDNCVVLLPVDQYYYSKKHCAQRKNWLFIAPHILLSPKI
jgi:hypothetical protein